MKEFVPLDVARILRAMDDAEYATIFREHALDVILAGNEARAFILTEAGSRAWFVMNPEDEEFSFTGSPREGSTTVVTYGPTRGMLGDFIEGLRQYLTSELFERLLDLLTRRRR
jgi:hypothetical protein